MFVKGFYKGAIHTTGYLCSVCKFPLDASLRAVGRHVLCGDLSQEDFEQAVLELSEC